MQNPYTELLRDPFIDLPNIGLDPKLLSKLEQKNKYWGNTLLPLINSGHMGHMIDGTYVYPNRVGIFPGLSCMYYCDFCGRNKSASYDRSLVPNGIDVYKDVMRNAPKTPGWENRFRISGGQEPLTNPLIGELVEYGASLGLKLGMYTNGHMLTPRFLEKHPGLTELDYLRFSIYGYNEESYERTTMNPHAYEMVFNNLVNLVNTTDIKVGVNWIILPGRIGDYLEFIMLLIELQKKMRRPLDFITVREDFSQSLVTLSDTDRENLRGIFSHIRIITKDRLPGTKIDYGYQLHPMTENYKNGPLHMAKHTQLDPKGLPQATVQIDIKGNVYVFHETAFLDRPGSEKFIIGNAKDGLENVVKMHLSSDKKLSYIPSDVNMLDAYDHAVSLAVWRGKQNPQHPIWSIRPANSQ